MHDTADASLITRVLVEDDRGAFADLVNRHQGAIRGLLRRLCGGDSALADDLAQETFVRAYRGLRGFRGGSRLATWLHRIAYNCFLDHHGRAGRWAERAGADGPEPPSRTTDDPLLRHDLERAMTSLRPAEAAALTLSYVHLHSHEEIAEVLGCPVGTVKTHIFRGKQRLRAYLDGWSDQRRGAP